MLLYNIGEGDDMNQQKKIDIVQGMQDYIKENPSLELEGMYEYIGYSKRHADRIFSELLHMTPKEYVRKVILTASAEEIVKNNGSIINIAMDAGYETHEGFSRAFKRNFNINPDEYRKNPKAIPMFVQYPVWSYYTYLNHKERLQMDKNTMICTVVPVEKPKRKLIILRSKKAHDYWSFCEESGCDWEGLLNSIPEKLDTVAIVELPDKFIKDGTSNIAAGIEVPCDYNKEIPKGFEVIEIEAGMMLVFRSEPFEDEKDFGIALDCIFRAYKNYNPREYGYEYDFTMHPKFNYGATPEVGAKLAFPVKKIEQ